MKSVAITLIAILLFASFAHAEYDTFDNETYKRQRNGGIAMIIGGAVMIGGGLVMANGEAESAPVMGGIVTGIGVGVNVGGIIVLVKANKRRRMLRTAEPRPISAGDQPKGLPLK